MYNDTWESECRLLLLGRQSSTSDFDRREDLRNRGRRDLEFLVSSPGARHSWLVRLVVAWALREEERREWSRRKLREWDGLRPVVYWYKGELCLYMPDLPTSEEQ